MQDSIVELIGARKRFASPEGGEIKAIDTIDLSVRRNEFLTLLGPSGCGKTTLLQSIGGFVRLDGGTILIDGEDMTNVPPHRRPVNTVFQNYALFPHMTVGQNVGYALEVAGVAARERRERTGSALTMVGLDGLEKRYPRQLSGGQQQRVALARAIVGRPKLLLLDEPLSALDRGLRHSMQIELKTLQNELGISFVFVTHDQEEALTMSDRIAVLKRGRIQQLASPRDIYDRPQNAFVAGFVGANNMFEGRVENGRMVLDDGGILSLACSTAGYDGKTVAIIRPEQFSLAQENDSRPRIDVTIDQIIFVGASFEVYTRTESGRALTVSVPAAMRDVIAKADAARRAQLTYDPAHVHLMSGVEGEPGK